MTDDNPKRLAAEQAASRVRSGTVIGLGTGSTAAYAVEAIGRRIAAGDLTDVIGIPTSRATQELASHCGIPLTTLNDHTSIDLTIDGADEVDPAGNLIKGGGGALLWEKIVAAATREYLIIVDPAKLVDRLGAGFPLPVEVMPFGWRTHVAAIEALGAYPALRTADDGSPFTTDGGHYILDCRFDGGIDDPGVVDRTLIARPGVVETGLFLGMHPDVIVGRPAGT
jgi:ribose 5-phosphate isomerase A